MCHASYNSSLNRPTVFLADHVRAYATLMRLSVCRRLYGMYCGQTSVCYCQIRQLRLLRRSLSFKAAHALVRALVHSRLDYCNAVLANAPQMLVAPLQSVLRSAARVVLRCPHRAGLT